MFAISEPTRRRVDVAVIGGGLAGLTAAAIAAREGKSVVLLEQAKRIGGRAATRVHDGVHFNLGPHALYRAGHAARVLKALGVPYTGGPPPTDNALVFLGGRAYRAPFGFWSLLTSRLLGVREKLRLINFLRSPGPAETRQLDHVPLRDWLRVRFGEGNLAALLKMLFRVGTYTAEPGGLSAGAALDQFRLALAGVWYIDGGWQSLADGLRDVAIRHGATTVTEARADAVVSDDSGVRVHTAGGSDLTAGTAVLAVGPDTARRLLGLPDDAPLARRMARAVPAAAACLDVALDRLPSPRHRVAFGIDEPLYYSVHSSGAKLARPGVAVIHVMKYLAPGSEHPAKDVEARLEAFLDRLQPGWRSALIERRFLPNMVVANDTPRPEHGGLPGRPGVEAAGVPNAFLAGDWVGPDGLLADAAVASGEAAARAALDALDRTPARSLEHAGH